MKTLFIVTTTELNTGYHVHSKYEQLPQMYHFKRKKDALECCDALNKRANKEYNESILLTTNKGFGIGVDKFITNY